ncbi:MULTISPECIES: ATP-binding protein [Actinomycetes]|uniref:sensor histidine kinase n=1 Tax=Branchiibius sp. NY16-3462-2 TaxID=1807500 RepID=UPI0007937B9F|nr:MULTISPECIES: ATP-binding protein [Actinomycetes]KYH45576.1 two-component sensor histidine kinase [Branchiibius sp. NY16-3462-2]
MTARQAPSRAWPRGLAGRLLAGQTIVLLAGALTAGLVATLVGPPIFHDHLLQSGHRENSPELAHIEMAYRDASLISVGGALLISLLAATAVSWFLTRRLRDPLNQITGAARELSRGHYGTRVPSMGAGTELETLADTFNDMAARLEGVEDTRRRMLSDLAHELRTPIATLSAYHEGLHDGVAQLGPESRTALAEQTGRLARLADDIDEVSTAEEGRLGLDRQDIPLATLLWAAHEGMRDHYADKGVNLVVDTDAIAGLHVTVDRNRIGQVLTNLLSNALRHTPVGGTVTIVGGRADREATITVADNGEGLTTEQLAHAFERFYRGDSARTRDRTGSGIGLTISKAIVDAHGGSLTADSPGLGQGASFTITLGLA